MCRAVFSFGLRLQRPPWRLSALNTHELHPHGVWKRSSGICEVFAQGPRSLWSWKPDKAPQVCFGTLQSVDMFAVDVLHTHHAFILVVFGCLQTGPNVSTRAFCRNIQSLNPYHGCIHVLSAIYDTTRVHRRWIVRIFWGNSGQNETIQEPGVLQEHEEILKMNRNVILLYLQIWPESLFDSGQVSTGHNNFTMRPNFCNQQTSIKPITLDM